MQYHHLMQRLAAAALLAWINFALIFAAVRPATAAESNLPACCRRLGQHGCTMTPPASGPSFQAALCPMYPRGQAVPAQAKATSIATPTSTFAMAASHTVLLPETETRYRISCSRDERKRGPPISLS
jgi:hypothetical protein